VKAGLRSLSGVLLALALAPGANAADQAASSSSPPQHTIRNADFAEQPDNNEMQRAFPVAALRSHVDGKATIRCMVERDATLVGCQILAEDPPGLGFGQATLNVAQHWKIRPMTVDGAPRTGGVFQRTVLWRLPPVSPTPDLPVGAKPVLNTDFEAKPDNDVMERNYPRSALRRRVGGEARVKCTVTSQGALDGCTVLSEEPSGEGFGQASLNVTPYFKVRPRAADGTPTEGAIFIRNFVWRPPPG
jgi:TonB family protein